MAFPTITADTELNDLALARHMANSVNKRLSAIQQGLAYPALVSTGTNLKTFISAAQDALAGAIAISTSARLGFADPALTLAGRTSLPSVWGQTNILAAAGLTASGVWRRIPEGTAPPTAAEWENYHWSGYQYGKIQQRDIAGPWLWADLISLLAKLTRTVCKQKVENIVSEWEAIDSASGEAWTNPYAQSPGETLTGNVSVAVQNNPHGHPAFGGNVAQMQIAKGIQTPPPNDPYWPPNSWRWWTEGKVECSHCVMQSPEPVGPPSVPGANIFSSVRRLIVLPVGDSGLGSVFGNWNLGQTNVVTDFEIGVMHTIERWFPRPPSSINQDAVAWSSISSQVHYDSSPYSKQVAIPADNLAVVTDFNFYDGGA